MGLTCDIGRLITRSPDIRRGRPCIAGTGGTVRRIAGWYTLGLSPEEIADRSGQLSLSTGGRSTAGDPAARRGSTYHG